MSELRTVVLAGELGRKFGREHKFAVRNAAEAVRALCANFPDFRRHVCESGERGVGYRVIVRDRDLAQDELHHPTGRAPIRFVPVLQGAKSGLGELIAGVALIGISFIPGLNVAAWMAFGGSDIAFAAPQIAFAVGAALALGGVSQMLAPHGNQGRAQTNYAFTGPVQTTAQGGVVSVGYGRLTVGSTVGSAGVVVDQLPTNETGPTNLSATVTFNGQGYTLAAQWDAAGNAVSYQVVISDSGVGQINTTATSILATVPGPGPWTVTVKPVENDGNLGPWASCVSDQDGQTDSGGVSGGNGNQIWKGAPG